MKNHRFQIRYFHKIFTISFSVCTQKDPDFQVYVPVYLISFE